MLCSKKLLLLHVVVGSSASGEDAPTFFLASGIFCDTRPLRVLSSIVGVFFLKQCMIHLSCQLKENLMNYDVFRGAW